MLEVQGTWGRGSISELGACVMSWEPAGHAEQLFVARDAQLIPGEMWHGGIPVCAPWFGRGRGDWEVPHGHGLVSRVPWRVESVEEREDAASVRLRIDAADTAHLPGADRYPADLSYRLDVEFSFELTLSLTISSPTEAVIIDEAFHPYLSLDATKAEVTGLEGIGFRDFATDATAAVEDSPVRLDRHVDRVYDQARATTVNAPSHCVRIGADGAGSVVVWNPGPGGDQVGDEWTRFACVEYGNVQGSAVEIKAGGKHTLTMTLSPG